MFCDAITNSYYFFLCYLEDTVITLTTGWGHLSEKHLHAVFEIFKQTTNAVVSSGEESRQLNACSIANYVMLTQ